VNKETITLIFVGATTVAVVLQAGVLLAMFIAIRASVKKIQGEIEVLRASALPLIDHSKELVKNISPKIHEATIDLAEVARGLRTQTMEFQASASEILDRVHRQTGRVDTMVTGALDTVDRASTVVNDAVSAPLKQLSGIAAFIRAAVDAFRSNGPRSRNQPTRPVGDKDLFV
jgi:hypothetical protein